MNELDYVLAAAKRLAVHSGSNRWGPPYADRREAFFQLRGALDAYDRSEPCEPSSCDERIVREARELAWWPHGNPSDRTIFQARKAAFTRLRDAIAAGDIPP